MDTAGEQWTLVTGRRPRLDCVAVAHYDFDADDAGHCFTVLRARWADLAVRNGAATIRREDPDGYWTLLGDDLHCGTPLQILTAAGTWLDGRYEIHHTPQGRQPVLYLALGALNSPSAPLTIPSHALLRHPPRRRR